MPDQRTYKSDVEVVQEINLQFDSASKSAADVSKMLEVDKMPYNQKNSGLKHYRKTDICRVPGYLPSA